MKKHCSFLLVFFIQSCAYIPTIPDFSESFSDLSEIMAPKIYKKDILQGSVIREDKLKLVREGMSKIEAIELLGSPSISSPFHKNQWEYIHYSILKNDEILDMRIILYFQDGKVNKIDFIKIDNLKKITEFNSNSSSMLDMEHKKPIEEDPWYKFW